MDDVIAVSKPKRTLLPVLIVLFLISYGLMSRLVVEQGRTIDAQRYLIRALFTDSAELSALKGKAIQKLHSAPTTQAPSAAVPSAKIPPKQAPPANAQAATAQPKRGTTQDSAKVERNPGKGRKRAPQKPPSYTSDTADERRALFTI
jgi:hypothetical protein